MDKLTTDNLTPDRGISIRDDSKSDKKKPKFVWKSKSSTSSSIPQCTNNDNTTKLFVSERTSNLSSISNKEVAKIDSVSPNQKIKVNLNVQSYTENTKTVSNQTQHETFKRTLERKNNFGVNSTKKDVSYKKFSLDNALTDFLTKISDHSALQKHEMTNFTNKEIEECKMIYIELLEFISEAFKKLKNLTKDVIDTNDFKTYENIDKVKTKLKSIIQCQQKYNVHENVSLNHSNTNLDSPNMPDKENNKSKKKFVIKRPSSVSLKETNDISPIGTSLSNTLERVKSASAKLQPVQTEGTPKSRPLPASSVPFQPQNLSKASLINSHLMYGESSTNNTSREDDLSEGDGNMSINSVSETMIDDSDHNMNSRSISIDEYEFQREIEDFANDIDTVDMTEPPVDQSNNNSFEQSANYTNTTYNGMGNFPPDTQNDGITGEFDGLNYPHSDDMMFMLKEKFGLSSFRPNQLQVINATILGHDCFVLMPTGGGKSLCYQLPAILTPGVTIVISPLKALILDQVTKLNSLDIPAAFFSGDMSAAQANDVYYELSLAEPVIRLLYVTPEKLSGSEKLKSTLNMLYSRDLIARFVVDEAHCVSAWGHDFRQDYKQLGELRRRYPRVRLMALTATATPRVRRDILHQLQVTNCKWFLCSFDRPNLTYEVLEKKPKNINNDIISVIRQRFPEQAGIVYCLSRKECDELALQLRRAGLAAAAYHAGLAPARRDDVQAAWLADRYRVICATIAFGMGVDKADVRFVIHHSLPKSVEGFYQEAGRAGRDGEPAACLLYYNYCDVARIQRMLNGDKKSTEAARRVHLDNLRHVAQMCEDASECRRAQVLAYLGESYERQRCARGPAPCDTCRAAVAHERIDVTAACVTLARALQTLRRRFTLLQLADALHGSKQQRLAALHGTPLHGLLKSWTRGDPQRLLRQLLVLKVLGEHFEKNGDICNAYITTGPNINQLLSGELRVEFTRRQQAQRSTVRAAAPDAAAPDAPAASVAARLKTLADRCYADLVEACREMASQRGASLAALFPQAALRAMAARLPETSDAMLELPHVTRANYDKYGHRLLAITTAYATEKLGILMEYQDELEAESAETSSANIVWSGGNKSKTRRPRSSGTRKRGGVRKSTKREGSTIAKSKALTSTAKARIQNRARLARGAAQARGSATARRGQATAGPAAGGSRLGGMPVPRATSLARPGVLQTKLNF